MHELAYWDPWAVHIKVMVLSDVTPFS